MLKTKCFIVGGMILSSSLQAKVPDKTKSPVSYTTGSVVEFLSRKYPNGVKDEDLTLEDLKLLKEENNKKLREYEVKEANELRRKVERHDEEIKELKRELEMLDNKIDSIRRTIILNAPLPEMHPPVLFR